MDAPQHAHSQDPGICHNCKEPLELGAKFCGNCGTPVPTVEHPAQKVQRISKAETVAEARTEFHSTWKLSVTKGPDQGKIFTLGAVMRIGRGVDNEVQLIDTQSSRNHAVIRRSAQGAVGTAYIIEDLGSTNGTLVNGTRISGPTALQVGTTVQVGNTHFVIQGTPPTIDAPGKTSEASSPMHTPVIPITPPPIPSTAFRTRPPSPQTTSPQQRPPPPPPPQATSPQHYPPPPPPQATSPQQHPPPSAPHRPPTMPPSTNVPPPPPSQTTPGTFHPPPQPKAPLPKKKRNWLRTCLVLFALSACGLVVAGVGIYYGLTTGFINQRTIFNAIGQGAGEVTVTNISDSDLNAELIQLETDDGQPSTLYTDTFFALDIGGWGGIQPGLYDLVIIVDGPPFGGTCRMRFESGDQYSFFVVPEGIAIAMEGNDVITADELDMATSSLCRK